MPRTVATPIVVDDPGDPTALEHEPPDERGDHRRQSPREQDDDASDPPPPRQRIERQSERHAEDDLDRHAHTCKKHRVHDGLPQPLIGKRCGVVAEPDKRPPEPRHSQVGIVQRLPDSGQEGPNGDGTEEEQRRRQQGPRETHVPARH